ncbi:hypothetical protein BKA80DRAFT_286693 [Phyllosticta citrichinensis]
MATQFALSLIRIQVQSCRWRLVQCYGCLVHWYYGHEEISINVREICSSKLLSDDPFTEVSKCIYHRASVPSPMSRDTRNGSFKHLGGEFSGFGLCGRGRNRPDDCGDLLSGLHRRGPSLSNGALNTPEDTNLDSVCDVRRQSNLTSSSSTLDGISSETFSGLT